MKHLERVVDIKIVYCDQCPYFKRPEIQTATIVPDVRCSRTNSQLKFTVETQFLKAMSGGSEKILGVQPYLYYKIPDDCPLEDQEE